MLDPVDVKMGPHCDLLDPAVLEKILVEIKSGSVSWVWIAPPCWSHSAAQNGRRGGPLRSKERPEGVDPHNPVVILGNRLWCMALLVLQVCREAGVFCTSEHPLTAYSWAMKDTLDVMKLPDVFSIRVDMCRFPHSDQGLNQKPTRLLSTAPFVKLLEGKCPGGHTHAPYLCGARAKNAAHYSVAFCAAYADAIKGWRSVSP